MGAVQLDGSNISPGRDNVVTAIGHPNDAVKITPTSPLRAPSPFKVDSLEEAAKVALRTSGPLKVWRATAGGRHELFFYRDLVIHASAEGKRGLVAIRRMLDNHAHAFTLDEGRWPAEHTMLMEWSKVIEAARGSQPLRQSTLQPVRYTDESEATVPLSRP